MSVEKFERNINQDILNELWVISENAYGFN